MIICLNIHHDVALGPPDKRMLHAFRVTGCYLLLLLHTVTIRMLKKCLFGVRWKGTELPFEQNFLVFPCFTNFISRIF